jgi:hypothetical protein
MGQGVEDVRRFAGVFRLLQAGFEPITHGGAFGLGGSISKGFGEIVRVSAERVAEIWLHHNPEIAQQDGPKLSIVIWIGSPEALRKHLAELPSK